MDMDGIKTATSPMPTNGGAGMQSNSNAVPSPASSSTSPQTQSQHQPRHQVTVAVTGQPQSHNQSLGTELTTDSASASQPVSRPLTQPPSLHQKQNQNHTQNKTQPSQTQMHQPKTGGSQKPHPQAQVQPQAVSSSGVTPMPSSSSSSSAPNAAASSSSHQTYSSHTQVSNSSNTSTQPTASHPAPQSLFSTPSYYADEYAEYDPLHPSHSSHPSHHPHLGSGHKRPRLRLAHACDRCRRRKIRCDTQQPCGPCKHTGNLCTFETPSKRVIKGGGWEEGEDVDVDIGGGGSVAVGAGAGAGAGSGVGVGSGVGGGHGSSARRKSASGSRSHHSKVHGTAIGSSGGSKKASGSRARSSSATRGRTGPGPSTTSGSGTATDGISSANADLEARLENLESLLRQVPPNVHNALINSLDSHLTSVNATGNTNANLNFGMIGNGGNLGAVAGAGGAGFGAGLNGNGQGFDFGLLNGLGGLGALGNSSSNMSTPPTAANGSAIASTAGQAQSGGGILDDFARSFEGLSLSNGILYIDEIGQTKWQGSTSGFPLLDLLTASTTAGNNGENADLSGVRGAGAVGGLLGGAGGRLGGGRERDLMDSPDVVQTSPDSLGGTSASNQAGTGSISVEPTFSSILMDTGNESEDDGTSGAYRRSFSSAGTGPNGNTSSPYGHANGNGFEQEQGRGRRGKERERFFPGRAPRPSQMLNPEATWRLITNVIPSDLMDTLVRCYLSTSHLLWPFLHVPSFLSDYANPQKWSEPGFACFVVAVCTLSSRHVDDPRVRAKVDDPSTAGKQYFELFKRLRDLPSADRPTLYSIQAAYLAAIYAFGLGTLSKAFSLLAESVTLCLDGGIHRSVEGYEYFTPIEQETRKRTFWSIYSWDKQSAVLFGRPPIIHLRDCDVPEPLQIDDEYITKDAILDPPKASQTRLSAFVAVIRLHVILEGVIDACVIPSKFDSPFLARAASTISRRSHQSIPLQQEESLLDEWVSILPAHWHYNAETVESKDPIRITQAERLHCLEHLVRMIIYRHRFSGFVQVPAATDEERARFFEYCKKAMDSALTICANHVHISQRGMMTYYGVHVIHQLAQAGRTLVAVVLNCKTPEFSPLIAPATEGLRSCVGLLRRFSGRYLCGLRSADIIEEFCRICHIPVDTPRGLIGDGRPSPAWLRPVRKRQSPSPAPRIRTSSSTSKPSSLNPAAQYNVGAMNTIMQQPAPSEIEQYQDLSSLFADALDNPTSANALLSTQDYFDLTAAASPVLEFASQNLSRSLGNVLDTLGPASAPFDQFETLEPDAVMMDALPEQTWDVPFASGNDALGQMSASTILSLMQQGTFSSSWV